MAVNLWRCITGDFHVQKFYFVRRGSRIRGKPPGIARTIRQRLDELKETDELFTTRIDIGLPPERASRSQQFFQRLEHLKKQRIDSNLEKLARSHKLTVNLEDVKQEWLKDNGPYHIKRIAEHYGVFEHLYGEGYFIPRVNLNIFYDFNESSVPVYFGNIVKPSEAANPPELQFNSDEKSLWTVTLINLDGHLSENGKEYIHWCVTNIPGNEVHKGDTIVQYLQPIPPKGTGYHRYVYVLYKQNERLDYSIKRVDASSPLVDRTFTTREWYKQYQDNITPAGLAFFQSDWDRTLTAFFHEKLDMREPVFEYDFPVPYSTPQKWFPIKQAFNLYLDRYRDPKQIAKENLIRKLKTEHPFKKPDPPLKYPNAQAFPRDMPSWLRLEEKKRRLGWGRINDV